MSADALDSRDLRESIRVGFDVVYVSTVARSIERFGNRYLARVFSPHEIASCTGGREADPARLAARFAAKEAATKVLRPGQVQLDWRSIEVRRHDEGWCDIKLHGAAARLAARSGICEMAVSLTHEGEIAAAAVVAKVHSSHGPQQPMSEGTDDQ